MDFNLKSIVCLLILLVSVETAFGDEQKALEYLEKSNLTLHDVFISVHKFNHKLVYGIVRKLGHNPHSLLHEIYPDAAKVVNASFNKIYQCYDTSIERTELDIFRRPIGQIVLEFFHAYVEHLDIVGLKEYVQRVKALLHTLRELAKHVLECVFNDDDDFEPTKLGLTPFSAYTQEQFVERVSNKQLEEDDDEVYLSGARPFGRSILPKPFREEGPEGEETWPNREVSYRPRCAITTNEIEKLSKKEQINWKDLGFVSSVKDQKGCASCYIFSAIGVMEAVYNMKFNTNVVFNEQTFLNCYPRSVTCDKGGVPRGIMGYAQDQGIVLDQDGDKYTASINKNKCKKPKPIFTYPANYCEFNPGTKPQMNSVSQLEAMIVKYGPVAVGIRTYTDNFKQLKGSAWNQKCVGDKGYKLNSTERKIYCPGGKCEFAVDHAVIAVGFNEKYWIIKNSWGTEWGVDGYLLLPKKDENNCGILTLAAAAFFHGPSSSSSTPKPEESTENQDLSPSTSKPEESTEKQNPSTSTAQLAESIDTVY